MFHLRNVDKTTFSQAKNNFTIFFEEKTTLLLDVRTRKHIFARQKKKKKKRKHIFGCAAERAIFIVTNQDSNARLGGLI